MASADLGQGARKSAGRQGKAGKIGGDCNLSGPIRTPAYSSCDGRTARLLWSVADNNRSLAPHVLRQGDGCSHSLLNWLDGFVTMEVLDGIWKYVGSPPR